MKSPYPIKTNRKCFECGSDLLLIDKRTEVTEGQRSPVTTSIYQCSDKNCQENIDKRTSQRIQLKKEQEIAKTKRMENTRQNRQKSLAKKR